MLKNNILWIIILLLVILFAIFEWKWFTVLFCLFIVVNILIDEIKGIRGDK